MKIPRYTIFSIAILALLVLAPTNATHAQSYSRPGVYPATMQVRDITQNTSWQQGNIVINRTDWVQLNLLPVMSRYPSGFLSLSACWIQNAAVPFAYRNSLSPRGSITGGALVSVPNPAPGTSSTYVGYCYYNCIGGSQQNCSINQGGPNVNLGWISNRITITTNPLTPPPPSPACSDTQDNDGDGLIDYGTGAINDPGCSSSTDNDETNTPVAVTQCSDGIDNSDPEDTIADAADPGCHTDGNAMNAASYNAADTNETDVTQCNDGIDNDGDGRIDFPNDTDCTNSGDTIEAAPPTITANGKSSGIIVRSGASVRIDWQTNGGTNCSLSPNVQDNDNNSNNNGTDNVTVRNQSTFTITCNGQSDSVTVQVLPIIYE